MKGIPLMAHLVLGYPNAEASYQTAISYAEAKVKYIELQIPFSHPTADGSVITSANQQAVNDGFTTRQSLALIERIAAVYPAKQIMVMTYANKLFAYGITQFLDALGNMGIHHLIVPDLAYDSPEAEFIHAHKVVKLVPVVAANLSEARFEAILKLKPSVVYLMAGYKLTGSSFELDLRLKSLVAKLKEAGIKAGIGFGIATAADIAEVLQVADFAIVGSALITAADEGRLQAKLTELASLPV